MISTLIDGPFLISSRFYLLGISENALECAPPPVGWTQHHQPSLAMFLNSDPEKQTKSDIINSHCHKWEIEVFMTRVMSYPQIHKSYLSVPQNVTICRQGFYRDNLVIKRSQRWTLIQYDWFHQSSGTATWREDHLKTQGEDIHLQARTWNRLPHIASEETNPADPDFQPPELWRNTSVV